MMESFNVKPVFSEFLLLEYCNDHTESNHDNLKKSSKKILFILVEMSFKVKYNMTKVH